MKLAQINIIKVEEPVDAPRGEVFKVSIFDNKECLDTFYFGQESDALDCVRTYLEDLYAQ